MEHAIPQQQGEQDARAEGGAFAQGSGRGDDVRAGDVVIAMKSSGLHSNGYSLARKVVFERMKLGIDDVLVDKLSVRDALLAPTRLYVNELAMRPHNSGHWSMDGAVTGQFEQHLRAVLDLPLGSPRAREQWTVMGNVLGGEPTDLYPTYRHLMARDPELKMHLYGKAVRPGRKIGHVNVSGTDLADLRERARHAADYIQGVITE